MIDKLSRGLTIEIVFVAAFIGIAFWSPVVMLISILPGLFPIVFAGKPAAASGPGAAIRKRYRLDRLFRPRAERDHSFPEQIADRGHRSRPRRGRRAGDDSGRATTDSDVGGARLRIGDDGPVQPAVIAAFRLAERSCHDSGAVCRSVHVAADRHVPEQDRPEGVAAIACAIEKISFGRRLR